MNDVVETIEGGNKTSDWQGRRACVVVAVGASAGGFEAFRELLGHMRPDSGIAIIFVQHLDPRHPSTLASLLAAHTLLPIRQAAEGVPIEPDHAYVIPANAVLTVERGILNVETPRQPESRRNTIDVLFRSLAKDRERYCVSIVLSGAGTDGASGTKAVKEHGGLTLVQEPATARYSSMPECAIATGCVDRVVPVHEMAEIVREYARRVLRDGSDDRLLTEAGEQLPLICSLIRDRTGHDFTHYKRSSLLRRIERRMQLARADSAAGYVEMVQNEPGEIEKLLRELLIGVTAFFRDREAFAILDREVLPKLLAGASDGQLRVWVPACSTGEEAYSLAILLHEQANALVRPPRIQIFATDIDHDALDVAREGRYQESSLADVEPERVARYFAKSGASDYRVVKELRELCVFSQHNVIRDPPFSRLDLISCRNLLIYLEPEMQRKVLSVFHYALSLGGHLFLGPSENVTGQTDLFRPIDKKLRIFEKKSVVVQYPSRLPLNDADWRSPRHVLQRKMPIAAEQMIERALERLLIELYAPPCIVINDQGDIVFFSGPTGKYLDPPSGALNVNVVNMVKESLRPDLRGAVHQAVAGRREVVRKHLAVEHESRTSHIDLVVRPLDYGEEDTGLFVVVFRDADRQLIVDPSGGHPVIDSDGTLVQQLENELKVTKEHLHTTIEELETSNEELKSSNEELLSMNEELQSLNEEFETVNVELKAKLDELDALNNDLTNLLVSTSIATVFVDREFNIRRFTPAATLLFRLIDGDIGRPIADIVPRFDASKLLDDAQRVLSTLGTVEREVTTEDGRCCHIMRMLPYRTLENVIDGIVITFIDVTALKEADRYQARLAAIVECSDEAIIGKTLDGVITNWNAAAERMYGYTADEAIGRSVSLIVPPDKIDELSVIYDRLRRGERIERLETERVAKDGRRLEISLHVSPIEDSAGNIIGASALGHDVTPHRAAERELLKTQRELRDFVESASIALHSVGADGTILWANDAELRMLGYTRDEYLGKNISDFHVDGSAIEEILSRLQNKELLEEYPAELRCKDGSIRHVVISTSVYWENGEFKHTRCFTRDVTERIRAERALEESEREFRALFENAGLGIVQTDADTGSLVHVNPHFAEMLGYGSNELIGRRWFELSAKDEIEQELAAYRRLAAGEIVSYSGEKRYVKKDGAIVWAQTTATVTRALDGRAVRIMAVVEDVTAKKRAELELVRARQAAEAASRAKDEFLAVLSHELRTPLTPALSAASLIASRPGLDPDLRSKIEVVTRNIELEARLIDDLLDLTRISHGKLELKVQRVDAKLIVLRAIEICREELDARDIRVDVEIAPGEHWVEVDPARLEQVAWNLLKNAAKFSHPHTRIEVSCFERARQVVIEVKDQGVGIAAQALSKIFDAFEQGHEAQQRQFGGLGLGLAISRKLIELHGGTITAESAGIGHGATFRVFLPLAKTPGDTVDVHDRSEPDRVARPLSILLVEDNEDTASMLEELLVLLGGHRVAIAASVAGAVELASAASFDLLISDLGLPDGSGHDIIRALRSRGQSLRAIALSGYGMEGDRRASREAGFDEHLVKPISARDLQAAVSRVAKQG